MAYPFYGSENSSSDFIISLKIGNDIVPINAGTKIVISCAMYTEFKIRITLKKEPFAVRFSYISHILDTKLRVDLMKKKFIHDDIMYSGGVAIKI